MGTMVNVILFCGLEIFVLEEKKINRKNNISIKESKETDKVHTTELSKSPGRTTSIAVMEAEENTKTMK